MDEPLDKFGRLLVTQLRDPAVYFFDAACEGRWKSPGMQDLQAELAALSPEQRDVARRALLMALDAGIHDFLFALQEAHDLEKGVAVSVDGENVAELSDGLQGEPWTDNGWIARFSRYPAAE